MSSILDSYHFRDEDFATMKFNVKQVDQGTNLLMSFPVLSSFPSFNELPEQEPQLDRNLIIRYICLNYDERTPLRRINSEFKRKSVAGILAGFPEGKQEGTFDSRYYRVMNCTCTAVNMMILDFLTLFDNPLFMVLESTYEQLYQKLRRLNTEVKDQKKNELELEKMRGDIQKSVESLQKSIHDMRIKYLNEENPYLAKDLYRTINEELVERLNLTPESRAFHNE